jgi:uncharacterized protein (DUF3084 family)
VRERDIALRADDLAAREQTLASEAKELETLKRRVDSETTKRSKQEDAVTARERALEKRSAQVAERERELAARGEELGALQRELEAKAQQLAAAERSTAAEAERLRLEAAAIAERQRNLARAFEVATASEPLAAPVAVPPPVLQTAGGNGDLELDRDLTERPDRNIEALAMLVERHEQTYPERVEEWRMYVEYLRDFAAPDGRLPSSFDGLVAEVFGVLLDGAAPASR